LLSKIFFLFLLFSYWSINLQVRISVWLSTCSPAHLCFVSAVRIIIYFVLKNHQNSTFLNFICCCLYPDLFVPRFERQTMDQESEDMLKKGASVFTQEVRSFKLISFIDNSELFNSEQNIYRPPPHLRPSKKKLGQTFAK